MWYAWITRENTAQPQNEVLPPPTPRTDLEGAMPGKPDEYCSATE